MLIWIALAQLCLLLSIGINLIGGTWTVVCTALAIVAIFFSGVAAGMWIKW